MRFKVQHDSYKGLLRASLSLASGRLVSPTTDICLLTLLLHHHLRFVDDTSLTTIRLTISTTQSFGLVWKNPKTELNPLIPVQTKAMNPKDYQLAH
jgi:hypothetical protein